VSAAAAVTLTGSTRAAVQIAGTTQAKAPVALGDTVHFVFDITNTGHRTLDAPEISYSLRQSNRGCNSGDAPLPPGGRMTCSAATSVTQAEIDAGTVTEVAAFRANVPGLTPVAATASVSVPTDATAAVQLRARAHPNRAVAAGDRITFRVRITNTGVVTLHGLAVVPTLAGSTAPSCSQPATADLAPRDHVECRTSYLVTPEDLLRGRVVNALVVRARGPSGAPVTSRAASTARTAPSP
jgi:uncharacterized repeat protein (TIGR01451 family)